jgi:hypothetical protein
VYGTTNGNISLNAANGLNITSSVGNLIDLRLGVNTLSAFKLTQLQYRATNSTFNGRDLTFTGYKNGVAVNGASITAVNFTNTASGSFSVVAPTTAAFNDIDEIRFTYSGAAVNNGLFIPSITIAAAIPAIPPAAPSNLQRNTAATYTPTDITLQWTDNSNNEDNFVLERARRTSTGQVATDGALVWTAISPNPAANTTSYRDYSATGLTSNTLGYFYRIKAVNVTGSSAYVNNSDAALPVTLRYFSGRMVAEGALLGWATAREANSSHFLIERSRDLLGFEAIANVPSQATGGTATNEITYYYTDTQPRPGVNYYRLVQVDLDGSRTLSKPIALSCEDQQLVLYPNPVGASGEAALEPALSHQGYQLSDLQGRMLYHQDAPGTLSRVSLGSLPAGVYTLQVKTETGPKTFRIMK